MMTMQKELAIWVMAYSQCCRCGLYLNPATLGTAIPWLGFCAVDQVKAGDKPSSGKPSVYVCCEEQMDIVMVVVIHVIKS